MTLAGIIANKLGNASTLSGSSYRLWRQMSVMANIIGMQLHLFIFLSSLLGEEHLEGRANSAAGQRERLTPGVQPVCVARCEEASIHPAPANALSGQAPGSSKSSCAPGREAESHGPAACFAGGRAWRASHCHHKVSNILPSDNHLLEETWLPPGAAAPNSHTNIFR